MVKKKKNSIKTSMEELKSELKTVEISQKILENER